MNDKVHYISISWRATKDHPGVFTSTDYKQHTSSQASLATRVRQWQEDSSFEIVCIDDKQHSGTLQTIAKDSMPDSFLHESLDMST